jgi:hypothetical protein
VTVVVEIEIVLNCLVCQLAFGQVFAQHATFSVRSRCALMVGLLVYVCVVQIAWGCHLNLDPPPPPRAINVSYPVLNFVQFRHHWSASSFFLMTGYSSQCVVCMNYVCTGICQLMRARILCLSRHCLCFASRMRFMAIVMLGTKLELFHLTF